MYHYTNQCAYNQDYQQCSGSEQSKSHHQAHQNVTDAQNEFDRNLQNLPFAPPMNLTSLLPEVEAKKKKIKKSLKKTVKKTAKTVVDTDTSNFSIEERLVAAVWVHERSKTHIGMGQIKDDFYERFGRAPPARNTLLTWERKLFATGSVRDAPRPGRPINRLQRLEEVAASLRGAPALSMRARARALGLPVSTLRDIMQRDLRPRTGKADKDKVLATKTKQPSAKKAEPAAPAPAATPATLATPATPAMLATPAAAGHAARPMPV